jgi:nitrogen PTS system EIIA component
MHLADFITLDHVLPEMRSAQKREALGELGALMAGPDVEQAARIAEVLADRERLASTAIGDEIAIPHGKLVQLGALALGLARSRAGLDFESVDGSPTRLFFVLLAPDNSTGLHLKALARISRLCKEPLFRNRLLEAEDATQMLEILCTEDAKFHVR